MGLLGGGKIAVFLHYALFELPPTQLTHSTGLCKLMSSRLQTKWLCVPIQLLLLKRQIEVFFLRKPILCISLNFLNIMLEISLIFS